jgi:hypothetical protein
MKGSKGTRMDDRESRMEDGMAEIRSFRDLNVYKLARDEARKLHDITRSFPREEIYSLNDDAWQSVGAMLRRMMLRADTFCPAAARGSK